jgi:hypothetical protein
VKEQEYSNDPHEMMRCIIARLEIPTGERNESGVSRSLFLLRRLHEVLQKGEISDEEILDFKSRILGLLESKKNSLGFSDFVFDAGQYAERGAMDGFAEACSRRSLLQNLNDHFVPWEKFKMFPLQSEIEDIDETLEEVSESAPPFRKGEIPDWVPESHWWWFAPKRRDMSENERHWRRHYEEIEPP